MFNNHFCYFCFRESVVVKLHYHGGNTCHSNNNTIYFQRRSPSRSSFFSTSFSYSIQLIPIVLNEIGTPDTHFETRGLPLLANAANGRAILNRIQIMSENFGTKIFVEEIENENKVVGWVMPTNGIHFYSPAPSPRNIVDTNVSFSRSNSNSNSNSFPTPQPLSVKI
jgi:hypothetical protein